MRCSLLSVALPLLLAFVPASFGGFGCAPASEEDADSSVDAVTRSSARLGPKAEAASDLANRLATTGFEKSTPFAMPLPGEIASKQFGAWKVAFVNDLAKKQRGFMLVRARPRR